MTRSDVGLLCGGHASEHVISLKSGRTLLSALGEAGYAVHPVVIGEDGTWNLLRRVPPGGVDSLPDRARGDVDGAVHRGSALDVATHLRGDGVRVIVLGLHGRSGEDGSIQGFLETAGFAWTGCGVVASAIAIDKVQFKRWLLGAGFPTPPFHEVRNPSEVEALAQDLGLPVVVKASSLGSSVHVHVLDSMPEVQQKASGIIRLEGRALLEQFVDGCELTVPVIGDGPRARPLPVIEIRPRMGRFFDYRCKYEDGGADEIVPALISSALADRVSTLAVDIHRLLGSRGVTRTDFMVDSNGDPLVLEINTLPGMTSASLVPKAATADGLSLRELVTELVEGAAPSPPNSIADFAEQASAEG